MGGGVRLTSRDFMKLGQLMLNDGMWGQQRVLPPGWAKQSSAPHITIGNRKYGYLWWIADYPYKGRTVRAYAALGNGGQNTWVVPELDLVATFTAGNYSDRTLFIIQNEYVPKYVLPAVN
jgi:CubicO group peptidase (beta-lactamase class C family)